jgi:hypothetical protein
MGPSDKAGQVVWIFIFIQIITFQESIPQLLYHRPVDDITCELENIDSALIKVSKFNSFQGSF